LDPRTEENIPARGGKKIDAVWKIMDALAAPMILPSAATEGCRKGGS
jgi:hypothetical protein